jgi:hypothetical protein
VSRADPADAAVGVLRSVRAAVVGLSASGLALSARRWTVGPLLAVLLGSQVLFHVAFSGAGTAHVHVGQHVTSESAMPGHPWLLMLVGHGVAALLTALLLRRGEDWLWGLMALLARAWRVVHAAAEEPGTAVRPQAMSRSGDVRAVLDLLEHAVARRGPPGLVIA